MFAKLEIVPVAMSAERCPQRNLRESIVETVDCRYEIHVAGWIGLHTDFAKNLLGQLHLG